MSILRRCVTDGVPFNPLPHVQIVGQLKSTFDRLRAETMVITLPYQSMARLKNVLEGEVLRGMQDYLVSVCSSSRLSSRNSGLSSRGTFPANAACSRYAKSREAQRHRSSRRMPFTRCHPRFSVTTRRSSRSSTHSL